MSTSRGTKESPQGEKHEIGVPKKYGSAGQVRQAGKVGQVG